MVLFRIPFFAGCQTDGLCSLLAVTERPAWFLASGETGFLPREQGREQGGGQNPFVASPLQGHPISFVRVMLIRSMLLGPGHMPRGDRLPRAQKPGGGLAGDLSEIVDPTHLRFA